MGIIPNYIGLQEFAVITEILKIEVKRLAKNCSLSEKRGFSANKISLQSKKFSFLYHELLGKYTKNYKEILNDILI